MRFQRDRAIDNNSSGIPNSHFLFLRMRVLLIDPAKFFGCVFFSLVTEFVRILIGFASGRKVEVNRLKKESCVIQADLSDIKSEQLEFVKKTKLERRKIEVDKKIEKAEADYSDLVRQWRRVFRFARGLVYILAAIYFTQEPVVMLDGVLLWPYTIFNSTCSVALSAWTILPICGFAIRYFYRAIVPLISSKNFP